MCSMHCLEIQKWEKEWGREVQQIGKQRSSREKHERKEKIEIRHKR